MFFYKESLNEYKNENELLINGKNTEDLNLEGWFELKEVFIDYNKDCYIPAMAKPSFNPELNAFITGYNLVELPLEKAKENVISTLKSLRKEKEVVEFVYRDKRFKTDMTTLISVSFAYQSCLIDENKVIAWKTEDGSGINLTKTDIEYIVAKISKYTEECFKVEINFIDFISTSNDVNTFSQVDLKDIWPNADCYFS